jgi:hypothetical protein
LCLASNGRAFGPDLKVGPTKLEDRKMWNVDSYNNPSARRNEP